MASLVLCNSFLLCVKWEDEGDCVDCQQKSDVLSSTSSVLTSFFVVEVFAKTVRVDTTF